MILLDLVAQGVRGLPPALRVQLKPGYSLITGRAGSSLWPAVEALCFADAKSGVGAYFGAPGVAVARLGSTFTGRDGVTYRLLREANGPGSLSRLEATTGKFQVVSQDPGEIVQFLRAQVGVPTRSQYQTAFTFSPAQWPSRRPAKAAPPAGLAPARPPTASTAPTLASQMPVRPASDVAGARSQLEVLRQELTSTKEADQVQFDLDGANRRIYECSQKVQQDTGLRSEVEQARVEAKNSPTPEDLGLPANVGERAARMENLEKARDDQLARLDREREQFLGHAHSTRPLYTNPELWAGIGVGLLSCVIGLTLGHGWRYLALLDIGAFGYAGVVALKWVGALQHNDGVTRRQQHYDDREKQIRDAFENEVMSIRTAMKLLKVESVEELVEMLGRRQVLEARIRDGVARLQKFEADPELAKARDDLQKAQAEVARLEGRLSQLSSFTRPSYQIDQEIRALEASIEAAVGGPPAAPVSGATAPPPVASGEDPCDGLLDSVTDLFQMDVGSLGGMVAPRASQYLMALSDRRFSGLEIGALGRVEVIAASGRSPAASLEARDRDLVYLAVKLTVMEKFAERQKLPLVFDDPFTDLDPVKVGLIGRMLKQIGSRTQVLHVSASAVTQPLADATVTLG